MDAVKRLVGLPTEADQVGTTDLPPEQVQINTALRECQGRALLTNLSVWPLLFGAIYFTQAHFAKNIGKYSRKDNLASSWVFSVSSAYLVWKSAVIDCDKTAEQSRQTLARKQANPYVK